MIDSLWRMASGDRSTTRLAHLRHGGFKMHCDLREMLHRQFYFFGTYFLEREILACWELAAKGARIVIDGGANAGIYSLAAIAAQSDCTVHAFEPTPEIAAELCETAALNRMERLIVHQTALWRENGVAFLRRCRGETGANGGMNYVTSNAAASSAEPVEAVCLDQFCHDRGIDHIDLLKLDLQGNENTALEGAKNLLRTRKISRIFVELNWDTESGDTSSAADAVHRLHDAGYRFSKPGPKLEWKKAGDWLKGLGDVVAKPAVRA